MTMPLWRSAFQTSLLILISPLYGASPTLDPHAEAVARIVEGAGGKVEKTEDGRSLKLVDLAVPGAGPHDRSSVVVTALGATQDELRRVVRVSGGWESTDEDWKALADHFGDAFDELNRGGRPQ